MSEVIQFPSQRNLLTIRELSQELKISINTIYYWVGRSEIPFVKLGRHLRFDLDQVLQFFNEKTREAVPCRDLEDLVEQETEHGSHLSHRSLKNREGENCLRLRKE